MPGWSKKRVGAGDDGGDGDEERRQAQMAWIDGRVGFVGDERRGRAASLAVAVGRGLTLVKPPFHPRTAYVLLEGELGSEREPGMPIPVNSVSKF